MNLRQKMALVMGELGYIKKRGRNTFSNYDYVMAADVAAECAKLMAKHGIAFYATEDEIQFPEVRTSAKGGALYVCRARIRFSFMDTDSLEQVSVLSTGEATDSGDKAIFKAKTGALKYALVQTFLIATGDDPEDDTDDKKTGGSAAPKTKGPEDTFLTEEEKKRLKLVVDGPTITPEKLAEVEKLIETLKIEEQRPAMLEYYKVSSLDKMTPAQGEHAIATFKKRLEKGAKS